MAPADLVAQHAAGHAADDGAADSCGRAAPGAGLHSPTGCVHSWRGTLMFSYCGSTLRTRALSMKVWAWTPKAAGGEQGRDKCDAFHGIPFWVGMERMVHSPA